MAGRKCAYTVAVLITLISGMLSGLLSMNWIEVELHISPDRGSGLFEGGLTLILLSICSVLFARGREVASKDGPRQAAPHAGVIVEGS